MKLIIGLGNPGKKYELTWHNVGFIMLDHFKGSRPDDYLACKKSTKFQAEICEGEIGQEKIILAKPQTFMNNSGAAVSALANFYKIKPQDVWVIHDDVDLPQGSLRISHNASAAGHKGVQSIIDALGTQNFVRFRIGIKPEGENKIPTESYVLQKLSDQDKMMIVNLGPEIVSAVELALLDGVTAAMNEFN